jgi:hypothetical protein
MNGHDHLWLHAREDRALRFLIAAAGFPEICFWQL